MKLISLLRQELYPLQLSPPVSDGVARKTGSRDFVKTSLGELVVKLVGHHPFHVGTKSIHKGPFLRPIEAARTKGGRVYPEQ